MWPNCRCQPCLRCHSVCDGRLTPEEWKRRRRAARRDVDEYLQWVFSGIRPLPDRFPNRKNDFPASFEALLGALSSVEQP